MNGIESSQKSELDELSAVHTYWISDASKRPMHVHQLNREVYCQAHAIEIMCISIGLIVLLDVQVVPVKVTVRMQISGDERKDDTLCKVSKDSMDG